MHGRVRLALALVLATVGTTRAEEEREVVRPAGGWRIVIPFASWTVVDLTAPAGTHDAVKLLRDPAPREVSLSLYTGDVPAGGTVEALRDGSAAGWTRRATGPVRRTETVVAGRTAATLEAEVESAGARVRVRQTYVPNGPEVVLIQLQSPTGLFEGAEGEVARLLASFAFLPPDPAREEDRRIRALAARSGSLVPRARTWAEAAARARREKRLVLVAFEEFRGLPIPPLADTTTFSDGDLVALCQERFVVLPWRDGLEAPFDRPDRFGLGPHTFGQGVLFATPDGDVVGSLGLLEPSLVEEAARRALEGRPEATGPASDEVDARLALRRGELDRAEAMLREPTTAEAWLLRADLLRRRRSAPEALDALESARRAGADAGEVEEARGLLFLRAGRLAEAQEAWTAAGARPGARYGLAVLRALRHGAPAVREELRALAIEVPETPWSWRAAAFSLGRGVATGMESIVWPDASVRSAALDRPGPASDAPAPEAARAGAVAWLLAAQRSDGTWPVPMSFAPDPTASTVVAVTAIAGSALFVHRSEPGVADAVRRARDAVLRGRDRTTSSRAGVFDYSVWAQVFALRFLAACATAEAGPERSRIAGACQDLVSALARSQALSGGWSYARLESAGASSDNSISFLTAAALLSLVEAHGVHHVAVGEDLTRHAADAVAGLRRPDGTWAYQTATPGVSEPTEAALRGPLCAFALAQAKRLERPEDVPHALDALGARLGEALREAGKPLCHTAPDATSAYYLLFGLRFAAEAARSSTPPGVEPRVGPAIRAAVMRLRRADGAFEDFPPIGPAYGTAMALEVLDRLR